MPATSVAQLRAMYAAKSGKSTLGIPKSVGADFVAATPSAKGLPAKKDPPKGGHKFAKAMHHHSKMGDALKAGNGQLAMQHNGHAMLAIRNAMNPSAGLAPNDDEQAPALGATQTPGSPMQSLRSRLSGLVKRSK